MFHPLDRIMKMISYVSKRFTHGMTRPAQDRKNNERKRLYCNELKQSLPVFFQRSAACYDHSSRLVFSNSKKATSIRGNLAKMIF